MIRNTTRNQKLGWVLFVAYLILLAYFLFFSEQFGRVVHGQEDKLYNLELFKEIKRFYVYRDVVGIPAFLINVVGNIIAFMPCGFFLPVISRRSKKWYNTIIICFGFSLCVEVTQFISRVGSFDVDDLFLNTVGGILGYIIYRLVQYKRSRKRNGKRQKKSY